MQTYVKINDSELQITISDFLCYQKYVGTYYFDRFDAQGFPWYKKTIKYEYYTDIQCIHYSTELPETETPRFQVERC
jgi:hypothetical protein